CLQRGVVAAKNIALGLADVGHTLRKTAARTQVAFAVPAILPQVPSAPRRRVSRFGMVIRDPEPAIRQRFPLRLSYTTAVQHLSQPIFAAIKTGINAGPLFDSLNERDGLSDSHCAAWIMAVFFE